MEQFSWLYTDVEIFYLNSIILRCMLLSQLENIPKLFWYFHRQPKRNCEMKWANLEFLLLTLAVNCLWCWWWITWLKCRKQFQHFLLTFFISLIHVLDIFISRVISGSLITLFFISNDFYSLASVLLNFLMNWASSVA